MSSDGLLEVAIPCDEVTVELTVVPAAGLTPLEQAIVGTISTGRNSVDTIASFLATHSRIVMDALHGLWVRGHVAIDFSSGAAELTVQAKRWLRDPDHAELKSGMVERVTWTYLHEPVSGAVLPSTATSRVEDHVARMPRSQQVTADSIPRDELLRALQSDLDRREQSLTNRVTGVSFGVRGRSSMSADRFVVTHARITDFGLGHIDVRLIDEPFRQDDLRRSLEQHMSQLCTNEPDSPFVQHLVARNAIAVSAGRTTVEVMDQLDERIDSATTADATQLDLKRREVLAKDAELQSALRNEIAAAAELTTVAGIDRLLTESRRMIDAAEHQIVFATPSIRYRAIGRLLDDLEAALTRGVRVIILWGERGNARLDSKVETLLLDLSRSHGDRILWSPRSARLSARFTIQDDRQLLLGTTSPLEVSGPDVSTRFGVVVRPSRLGLRTPGLTTDLLRMAKDRFPDYGLATLIRVSFEASEGASHELAAPHQLRDGPLNQETRDGWIDAWRELAKIRRRLVELLASNPAARLGGASDHRSVLVTALSESQPVVVGGRRIRRDRLPAALLDGFRNTKSEITLVVDEHDLHDLVASNGEFRSASRAVEGGVVVTGERAVLTQVVQ